MARVPLSTTADRAGANVGSGIGASSQPAIAPAAAATDDTTNTTTHRLRFARACMLNA